MRVWVFGIDGAVPCFAESGVVTVRTVNGVEKGVQEALAWYDPFSVVDVVGLEENAVLGVDDWVGNLEVEIGFTARLGRGGFAAVDAI